MNAEDAIDLVNRAVWRPGVEVRARRYRGVVAELLGLDYSDFEHGTAKITVEFVFETYDSSVVSDSGVYRKRITMAPRTVIDVDGKSETDVLGAVLADLAVVHQHEDREFCRVKDASGRWVAPFHPHNDTDALYERYAREARA
jgi:hypothetical protein